MRIFNLAEASTQILHHDREVEGTMFATLSKVGIVLLAPGARTVQMKRPLISQFKVGSAGARGLVAGLAQFNIF